MNKAMTRRCSLPSADFTLCQCRSKLASFPGCAKRDIGKCLRDGKSSLNRTRTRPEMFGIEKSATLGVSAETPNHHPGIHTQIPMYLQSFAPYIGLKDSGNSQSR